MARSYGKFPNRYKAAGKSAQAAAPKNLRVKINGRYDFEQMTLLLQRVFARLEDQGAQSIEDCAIYLVPLNRSGERLILKDEKGAPLQTIEASLPVSSRFTKATAAW